ncbi:ArsR/SmtB family transcription factor [Lutispora saccharofermentans]|uniref:Metalloregulator ArsR/SmtB family transcription factor n=1 Tax=Lutispora saccharofermentans TaxID=3024236 RepID=A0ABT1NCJ2_9FIRM|nr:metalloregulator ArsR/SmtB family transcription factor [Lutispora saccharofermentans]MCQ1528983.1 metalloregulator ArsR/SmtB family transcription factor [Lutispora saccharofermentans]
MEGDFKQYTETAELLKVLAHPVRLCIVKGLIEKGSCNVSHMQGCLELPQSTISQHLQKLRAAGIVKGERNGLEITYSIADERVGKFIDSLFNE